MAEPTPAPRRTTRRPPAKKTAAKKAPAAAADAGVAGQAPAAPPPGPAADGLSLNQWLHELKDTPLRIEVFDRWWEFKQPTAAVGVTWDIHIRGTGGIRSALASAMFDQAASPERTLTGPNGEVRVIEALPGSAAADEFLATANEWVTPEAAEEFWVRVEGALFGPGEASAS